MTEFLKSATALVSCASLDSVFACCIAKRYAKKHYGRDLPLLSHQDALLEPSLDRPVLLGVQSRRLPSLLKHCKEALLVTCDPDAIRKLLDSKLLESKLLESKQDSKVSVLMRPEKCAARLTWELLHEEPAPWFMDLLEDQHLCRNKLKRSRSFWAYVHSRGLVSEEGYDRLMAMDEAEIKQLLRIGRVARRTFDLQVRQAVNEAWRGRHVDNYPVLLSICDPLERFDVAEALANTLELELAAERSLEHDLKLDSKDQSSKFESRGMGVAARYDPKADEWQLMCWSCGGLDLALVFGDGVYHSKFTGVTLKGADALRQLFTFE